MRILPHPAHAVGQPDLIDLGGRLYALRFETMKVASARAALHELLRNGTITPSTTVVDSSSGIYALALALACHEFGLGCRIIGSAAIDTTLRLQLELLGAHVEPMPPTASLRLDQERRVERIHQLLDAESDVYWMRQYHDPIHDAGYRPIGAAIGAALRGAGEQQVDLVAPVGSGVSSHALAEGVRQSGLDGSLIGVQPFGSVTFASDHVADPDMLIAGIGSSIPFGNVRHPSYDVVHWIAHTVAASAGCELMRRHALFAGLSTGAAYAAARHEHRSDGARATLLVAPDTGHRYAESLRAHHPQLEGLSGFTPLTVTDPALMERPWSRIEWGGRGAPAQACLAPNQESRRERDQRTRNE